MKNNGWNAYDYNKASDRYDILKPMLSIREGDIISVPKVSLDVDRVGRYFTLFKATGMYYLGDPLGNYNDFSHIIPVQPIKTISYDTELGDLIKKYQPSVSQIQKRETQIRINNSI